METRYLIFILVSTMIYCKVESQLFNHMQYVLVWPPTICQVRSCKTGIPHYQFIIETLRPARKSGWSSPPTIAIEDLKVDTLMNNKPILRDRLRIIWPNIIEGHTDEWLWKRQWSECGYCTQYALNITEYFEAAKKIDNMMMLKKMDHNNNLIDYLIKGDIKPSNHTSYEMRDIRFAISKLVGDHIDVYISCYINMTNHVNIMKIRLCVDPSVNNFVSCPILQNNICGSDTKIFLPTF
ncbi:ribonuclease 3-like [Solanum tuberosum]|uniref:ribonuclease 3-like n=1 Tax=Solanum tuberosum TaxID=4113 RepID=UPI0003D292F0|nr:PREDICTED: ribonuclease 3-like [Solanum tuberosum]